LFKKAIIKLHAESFFGEKGKSKKINLGQKLPEFLVSKENVSKM